MIASLLSEDNRWVNAQRIEVSGGMAHRNHRALRDHLSVRSSTDRRRKLRYKLIHLNPKTH